MIIAIEGIDGVGKTTVSKLLAERIRARYLKFPDRSTVSGTLIEKHLRGQLALGHEVFQSLQVVNKIEKLPLLMECAESYANHVVCDRYTESSCVYGTHDGMARETIETWDAAVPAADFHVLMTMSLVRVDGERLAGRDREIYEDRGMEGLCDQDARFRTLWGEHAEDLRWTMLPVGDRSPGELVDKIVLALTESL